MDGPKTAVFLAGDKVVGSSLTGFVAMTTPLEIWGIATPQRADEKHW